MFTHQAAQAMSTDLASLAKKVEGVYLPKDEEHLVEWMTRSKGRFIKDDRITYQWSKQEAAMTLAAEYIPDWRKATFVDVGAHVGLWSMWWGLEMAKVIAFEPIPAFRTIFKANMAQQINYDLLEYALSDEEGEFAMRFDPTNTGNTRAYADNEAIDAAIIDAPVGTLDGLLPGVLGVQTMGVLKIDCEGYEERVLRGGERMIAVHRPLIIVEQKKGAEYYGFEPLGAVDYLRSLGYRSVREMSGDHLMLPGERL